MKVALYYGKKDIRIKEIDYPKCPPGGVILKVKYVGICGGDVRNYYLGTNMIKTPMVTGHEVAGEVVEVGTDHGTYKVRDRLAMGPIVYCGSCFYCQNKMTSMCKNLKQIGFQFPGGFEEFMPIPAEVFIRGSIVPIPQGLSFKYAAACEPLSSCLYAQERAGVTLGDKVAIFGAGAIGCIHIQVAKLRGASKVIMIDIVKERLEIAKKFGADYYIDGKTSDLKAEIDAVTEGLGADKAIIAAPSAAAIEQSIPIVRKRATVVIFGGLSKNNSKTELDGNAIHYNDLNLMGHFGQERRHVLLALELIKEDKISAKKLITDIFPLKKIYEGLRLLKEKKALKILIKP